MTGKKLILSYLIGREKGFYCVSLSVFLWRTAKIAKTKKLDFTETLSQTNTVVIQLNFGVVVNSFVRWLEEKRIELLWAEVWFNTLNKHLSIFIDFYISNIFRSFKFFQELGLIIIKCSLYYISFLQVNSIKQRSRAQA